MLAIAALSAAAVLAIGRRRRGRAAGARPGAPPGVASGDGSPAEAPSPPDTRLRVGAPFGLLALVVVEVGLLVLVPWALAARGLGLPGVIAFVALVLPPALGLAHAVSRGGAEW